jgi:hypothetical protein
MEIDTTQSGGSATNTFVLPLVSGSIYDFIVDWGDGTSETITGSSLTGITKTYSTSGTYDVKISGTFPRIRFDNLGDRNKLMKIKNWGNIAWTSFERAFRGCANMDMTATDIPDLSGVSSLSFMFQLCFSLVGNPSFNSWNTSSITNMSSMFSRAILFNQPVGSWNTSNVLNYEFMFSTATSFNQNIGSWALNSLIFTPNGMREMLRNSGLDVENYSKTLIGWANYVSANVGPVSAQILNCSPLQYNCVNYYTGLTYNNAVDARNYLTSGNLIITDGGQTGAPC